MKAPFSEGKNKQTRPNNTGNRRNSPGTRKDPEQRAMAVCHRQ